MFQIGDRRLLIANVGARIGLPPGLFQMDTTGSLSMPCNKNVTRAGYHHVHATDSASPCVPGLGRSASPRSGEPGDSSSIHLYIRLPLRAHAFIPRAE